MFHLCIIHESVPSSFGIEIRFQLENALRPLTTVHQTEIQLTGSVLDFCLSQIFESTATLFFFCFSSVFFQPDWSKLK